MVPSQKASMSWMDIPADEAAEVAASVRRSSMPWSQSSPNLVHPMPMMATWSRMPLLPMAGPFARAHQRARLPEVIVHALRRVHPAEGHLHPIADRELRSVGIGELAAIAASAVEVDDHPDH